jgi:hypothetical protein
MRLVRTLVVIVSVLILVGMCVWYLVFDHQPYLPPGY